MSRVPLNFEVRVLQPKRALARFGRPTSLAGGPDGILARHSSEAGTVTVIVAASWVCRPRVRSADGAAELRLAAIAASMRPEASSSIAARRSAPRSARLRWRGARAALPSAQERNIVEHLPEAERPLVLRRPRAAPAEPDPKRAKVALFVIAGGLAHQRPGVAASLREGLADTLTINHSRARRASFGARSSRPTRWSC